MLYGVTYTCCELYANTLLDPENSPVKCAQGYTCVRLESLTSKAAIVGYHGTLPADLTQESSPAISVGSPTSGPFAACSLAGTEVVLWPCLDDPPQAVTASGTTTSKANPSILRRRTTTLRDASIRSCDGAFPSLTTSDLSRRGLGAPLPRNREPNRAVRSE